MALQQRTQYLMSRNVEMSSRQALATKMQDFDLDTSYGVYGFFWGRRFVAVGFGNKIVFQPRRVLKSPTCLSMDN